jgi:hypothetical protein
LASDEPETDAALLAAGYATVTPLLAVTPVISTSLGSPPATSSWSRRDSYVMAPSSGFS